MLNEYYSTKVSLHSAVEAGFYDCCTDGSAKFDCFSRANGNGSKRAVAYNGSDVEWWMKTPRYEWTSTSQIVKQNTSDAYGRGQTSESNGIRTMFIVPDNLGVRKDGTVYPKLIAI